MDKAAEVKVEVLTVAGLVGMKVVAETAAGQRAAARVEASKAARTEAEAMEVAATAAGGWVVAMAVAMEAAAPQAVLMAEVMEMAAKAVGSAVVGREEVVKVEVATGVMCSARSHSLRSQCRGRSCYSGIQSHRRRRCRRWRTRDG